MIIDLSRGPTPEVRALRALERAVRHGGARPELCWGYDRKTKLCRCPIHRALARVERARLGERKGARRG